MLKRLLFNIEVSAFSVGLRADRDIFAGPIESAPATIPAIPAARIGDGVARIAATPSMRPEIDSTPSFAPSNPARSHPDR
jgi:hypothetical protein